MNKAEEAYKFLLVTKRGESESYEAYRERRKQANKLLKKYLKGRK